MELILTLRRDFQEEKIIAISGAGRNNADEYLTLAKKLGAVHTIAKPFSRKEIVAAVRQVIN